MLLTKLRNSGTKRQWLDSARNVGVDIALGYLAPQHGFEIRSLTAAGVVMLLETAQRQGCWRAVRHRAANVHKLLVDDEIGGLPPSLLTANFIILRW